ncbi:FMN-binding split barrel protein [Actinidia chinensis var. chinensis]|uniref:FMN-binding split barrel protein n=1 Tax=Actinidia chinensis var. chinensis TaxID=1590841 RepID=A0A2R6RSL9_ACTCC|nr:FMN-binding split barrel protein [Actinidia chinensis var. chinensis]
MLMIESATAVQFSAGRSFDSASSRRISLSGSFSISWKKLQRSGDASYMWKRNLFKNRIRASAEEQSGEASIPIKQNPKPSRYHPFEEIAEPELIEGGDARLTAAETTRTLIEVNSKALLMFQDSFSDEVHEHIFWPDLPYVTDEHGNIYFQVKNGEDVLQTLTAEDNFVQVIVGLDTADLLSDMGVSSPSEIDFGFEEIDDDDSGVDDEEEDEEEEEEEEEDNHDKDWDSILEVDEDEEDYDESLGDWAKLETMRSSHPMYFAKILAEVVTDDPYDFMDLPPTGIAIQGLLRPAFIEEHSVIQKHVSDSKTGTIDLNQVRQDDKEKLEDLGIINGHRQSSKDSLISADELEKGETLGNGTSFYKLEMVKILLISAQGCQTRVEVEDLQKAQPDAIAHSAVKIISRLKAGGEKTTQALKSLCWRCKGIQVEEASIIGVDTLGFDLRACSGMQLHTLRFTFNKRASSEYSAERQLNDLLFPSAHQNLQKKREARQTES